MLTRILADKLEIDGVGDTGESIFVNFMPIGCKSGILLRSPYSGVKINHELPNYYKCEFTLIIRFSSICEDSESLVSKAVASVSMVEKQLKGIFVKHSRPITKPVVFQLSDGGLMETSVRFEAVYVEG